MNDKEALQWKQVLLRSINIEGELEFPSLKDFLDELLNYFQPMNSHQDAAHQLALLKQGNQMKQRRPKRLGSQAPQITSRAENPTTKETWMQWMSTRCPPRKGQPWCEKGLVLFAKNPDTEQRITRNTNERRRPQPKDRQPRDRHQLLRRRETLAKSMPYYRHSLSAEEMKELLVLQQKKEKKKEDNDEDFKEEVCLEVSPSDYSIYCPMSSSSSGT